MAVAYEEMEGSWEAAPTTTKSGLPVEDEQYIKNVRDNCLLDLPNLAVQKEHDKIMVMVCGGPTAKMHLEEIRAKALDPRYVVFCSNKTHDWLISEGIVPAYQFIIDPKPSKLGDVENPHKDVKYLIGISCDTRVFQALDGCDVTRVFSVSGIGKPSDVQVVQALFPYEEITYLFGGTMAGLRAMSLADVMGFLTVEYYGFDSCYFDTDKNGVPVYYSYDKMRAENVLETETADGRKFLTSPVFASQATQFIKWKHRYEWIKFVIHGESLTAAINEIDERERTPKHDLLVTEYHKRLNKELHQKEQRKDEETSPEDAYGYSGQTNAGPVAVMAGHIVRRYGKVSVLDYGCGKKTLEANMPPITGMEFRNYDPCIDGLDEKPEPADLVVCTDVLEHVELECLDNVLDDLARVTKQLAYISVPSVRASKSYSDGQNAHKIVEDHDWWRPKLKKRFDIIETKIIPNERFICVMQSKGLRT